MSKYRVWCVVNIPSPMIEIPVESPEAGARLIDEMAQIQLQNERIESNAFGLLVQADDGEWEEWEDENFDDVDALAESPKDSTR